MTDDGFTMTDSWSILAQRIIRSGGPGRRGAHISRDCSQSSPFQVLLPVIFFVREQRLDIQLLDRKIHPNDETVAIMPDVE